MIRRTLKRLLPPVIAGTISSFLSQRRDDAAVNAYLKGEAPPWSYGYKLHKQRVLERLINDEDLLTAFRSGCPLPLEFGIGLDERCIEYPWVLAHLPSDGGRLLDGGSTFNHAFILEHPVVKKKSIHIITLAPEDKAYWDRGVSYLFEDLRTIPIQNEFYDSIVCLSTLEHIGCDNRAYTGRPMGEEPSPTDYRLVIRELRRVLRRGGSLLLTVPFGVYQHFGWFQQFDRSLLDDAITVFGPVESTVRQFYRYGAEGWRCASLEECADAEYVSTFDHNPNPRHIPVQADRATNARAVACVKLVKECGE